MFLPSQLATSWRGEAPSTGSESRVYFLKPLPVPSWDSPCGSECTHVVLAQGWLSSRRFTPADGSRQENASCCESGGSVLPADAEPRAAGEATSHGRTRSTDGAHRVNAQRAVQGCRRRGVPFTCHNQRGRPPPTPSILKGDPGMRWVLQVKSGVLGVGCAVARSLRSASATLLPAISFLAQVAVVLSL